MQRLTFASLTGLRALIIDTALCDDDLLPAMHGWTALQDLRWLTFRSPYTALPAQLQQGLSRLRQLHHLELEHSQVQPPKLAGLQHLTALILTYCNQMTQLPAGISTLTNLARLDCSRCACLQ